MDDLFASHDALAIGQLVKTGKLGARELLDGVLREFFSRISKKPADDLTLVAVHHLSDEERR